MSCHLRSLRIIIAQDARMSPRWLQARVELKHVRCGYSFGRRLVLLHQAGRDAMALAMYALFFSLMMVVVTRRRVSVSDECLLKIGSDFSIVFQNDSTIKVINVMSLCFPEV